MLILNAKSDPVQLLTPRWYKQPGGHTADQKWEANLSKSQVFGLYLLSWFNLDQFPKLPSRYGCARCVCAPGLCLAWGPHLRCCHSPRTEPVEVMRGTLSPAGLQRCQAPWPCQHLPTSTSSELWTVQCPHSCLSPTGKQCQSSSHASSALRSWWLCAFTRANPKISTCLVPVLGHTRAKQSSHCKWCQCEQSSQIR